MRFNSNVLLLCLLPLCHVHAASAQDEKPHGQTVTRDGECSIAIEFALRVLPPKDSSAGLFKSAFAGLRSGVTVESNGHIELAFRNLRVAPLSGTVTFTFFRGPAGETAIPTATPYSFPLADAKAVNDFNHPAAGHEVKAPKLDQPPGMDAQHTPVTERIRIVASYKPDSLPKPCVVSDVVVVQWTWNGTPDQGTSWHFQPPNIAQQIPATRSRVDHSPGIVDETTGFPGQVNKATQTVVVFAVADPFGCCGEPGRHYAIVQFVRHRWKLGNNPVKRDDWNLDGPESQSTNHANGQPYDPTYTNRSGENGNDLVVAGPWDDNGTSAAISVYDFPGLLDPDHRRFMQTGGTMEWEFVTILVCLETPQTETQYLASAKVQAVAHYRVTRTYAGGEATVKVRPVSTAPIGAAAFFQACRKLKDILDKFGLTNAFSNPRPHVIQF